MNDYVSFLATKLPTARPNGLLEELELPSILKPFQRDIVRWALKQGRCAIFAGTGLGKTLMQLVWARKLVGYRSGPANTGIQHIQTAGDLRRGIAHLPDDQPVAFDHNNYPTAAYFEPRIERGYTIITVEANDTCYRPPADYAAEYNARARAYGGSGGGV